MMMPKIQANIDGKIITPHSFQANIPDVGIRKIKQIQAHVPGAGVRTIFKYKYAQGGTLGSAEIGDLVRIKEYGVLRDFFVINHGNHPTPGWYDIPDNAVMLWRATGIPSKQMNNVGISDYENSTARVFLEGEYYNSLDEGVRNNILDVIIPFVRGAGDPGQVFSTGENGLPSKVFILTLYDVISDSYGMPFQYFANAGGAGDPSPLRIVVNAAGSPVSWWTRQPANHSQNFRAFTVDGREHWWNSEINATAFHSLCPAFALPSSLSVSDTGEVIVSSIDGG